MKQNYLILFLLELICGITAGLLSYFCASAANTDQLSVINFYFRTLPGVVFAALVFIYYYRTRVSQEKRHRRCLIYLLAFAVIIPFLQFYVIRDDTRIPILPILFFSVKMCLLVELARRVTPRWRTWACVCAIATLLFVIYTPLILQHRLDVEQPAIAYACHSIITNTLPLIAAIVLVVIDSRRRRHPFRGWLIAATVVSPFFALPVYLVETQPDSSTQPEN